MIHSHYDSEQILWFVRNYWKYTRDNMIQEFRRTFHDPNFAKSQYQWLKTRYGMKEEWGASLNNPPYSGARPGGPGTEMYEPPDIPSHAPQMIFRTRSDSPTPNLVIAPPPAPMESGVQPHTTNARNRVSSSGSQRATPPDSCDYADGAALSTAQTSTHTAGGAPGFPTSNLASSGTYAAPGQINSLAANGLNGTYTFGFPQGLGSPFVPAPARMGSFNASTTNMAALNAPYPMPASVFGTNPSGGVNPFLRPENQAGTSDQQQTNCLTGQLGSGSNEHLLLATYPFSTAQPFQSAGGQYGATLHNQATTDSISQQYAFTGLGIDNHNYLGPQVQHGMQPGRTATGLSAFTNIGNMMAPTSMNTNVHRGMGSSGNDHLSLHGSHASSPPSLQGPFETIVSPHGPMTPVGPLSNRKRKLVEVECRPPTLPSLLGPTLQAARGPAGTSSTSSGVIAGAQLSPHGGANPAKKIKSSKSSVATSSPTNVASTAPGPADNIAATASSSPTALIKKSPKKSPKTPTTTSTSAGSHAGGTATTVNPGTLASVSHSTELARRVPEAPTMQAQLGSVALAQIMGMRTGAVGAAANIPAGQGALVLRDFAALSQIQTPSIGRTNSSVMPANSRPASRDTIYTSSPPSITVPPNDTSSGDSSRVVMSGTQAPTVQENQPPTAYYISAAAPVDASTVTPAVTSFDASSSGHGAGTQSTAIQDFSFGDYGTFDFASSSDDLDAMLHQDAAGSLSSFDDAMDELLFGDSFPGEANVSMSTGALQDNAAADNQASSAADSMSAMFETSSGHGSDGHENSSAPFSSSGGDGSTEAWLE